MERGKILLFAALMAAMAPRGQGTEHLSFANNTEVSITRDGCDVTKTCVESPDNCDPGHASCLFTSVAAGRSMAPNGTYLYFQLSGNSSGYIAVGLTANASEGSTMLYICAQNSSNNGSFFFRTMWRNNTNNMLTPTERMVTEIRGYVNGTMIQCEFNVPNVNATSTRSRPDVTFAIIIGKGDLNGSSLGPLTISRTTHPLNLANPNATANANTTAAPTTMATTTGSSGAVHPHAVLLLLSILTLFVSLRA